jgi:hypothetical protein
MIQIPVHLFLNEDVCFQICEVRLLKLNENVLCDKKYKKLLIDSTIFIF